MWLPRFSKYISTTQTLISFLKNACKSPSPDLDRKEVTRIQQLLEGYSASMASGNIVQALAHSLENKRTLLDVSSQLGLAADATLMDCLCTDEEGVIAHIVSIFGSTSMQKVVLALAGDSAQGFLDVVQEALERGALIDPDDAWMGRRIVQSFPMRAASSHPRSSLRRWWSGRDSRASVVHSLTSIAPAMKAKT
ncbi:hypothetical protein FB45DRAFT_930448 [Roridomyces roridus]|uniref:Uncharacterized protein n=1 Tax=Roridomyces roridus TaxID=1738132 RepID=A0AAD7BFE1_9AGAR|nr:hypothetical protein FB45DRAFT_930448 [Roridomyces roridus]